MLDDCLFSRPIDEPTGGGVELVRVRRVGCECNVSLVRIAHDGDRWSPIRIAPCQAHSFEWARAWCT